MPITESFKRKLRATGAQYRIKDNFFDFWFRFVYNNLPELERGNASAVTSVVKNEFPWYAGEKFERFVMELFPDLGIFSYTRIGKWWHKDNEIDIVVFDEGTGDIIFCECKWQNRKTDLTVLKGLMNKSKFVDWNIGKRNEHFAVVSKTDFIKEAEKFAIQNNFLLLTKEHLEKCFISPTKSN